MRRGVCGLSAVVLVIGCSLGCPSGRPPGGDGNDDPDGNENVGGVATCDVSGVELVLPDIDATLVGGAAPTSPASATPASSAPRPG